MKEMNTQQDKQKEPRARVRQPNLHSYVAYTLDNLRIQNQGTQKL